MATTRKVHFDFHAEGEEAWCGATPRNGAPALELSERRKDVTCLKCLSLIADYDAAVAQVPAPIELANRIAMKEALSMDAPKRAIDNAVYGGPTDLTGHSGDLYRSIAERHGLQKFEIENAFNDGILKR